MKTYFPLTDFDFYAYVLTGLAALVCVDYGRFQSHYILGHGGWSLAYGAGAVMAAFVVGLVVSLISGFVFEHMIACRVFGPPREFLLRVRRAPRHGILRRLSTSHYSRPLPAPIIRSALKHTAAELSEDLSRFRRKKDRSEIVFQFGYGRGRSQEDACRRMDKDRREYEVSRNLACVAALGVIFLIYPRLDQPDWWKALLAAGLSVVMFFRFIKYFTSYHAQVLRAAAFPSAPAKNGAGCEESA